MMSHPIRAPAPVATWSPFRYNKPINKKEDIP